MYIDNIYDMRTFMLVVYSGILILSIIRLISYYYRLSYSSHSLVTLADIFYLLIEGLNLSRVSIFSTSCTP